MTSRNQVALTMGEAVFRAAVARGQYREDARDSAAQKIVDQKYPKLTGDAREFMVWALLQAESMYMRVERPALPAGGRGHGDAQHAPAPAGENGGDGGHGSCDAHLDHAASPNFDDGGGAISSVPPKDHLHPSRRRLALSRSKPTDYPIYVPGAGMRAIGSLTKADFGVIYSDRKSRRRNAEEAERGWRRIYEWMPDEGALADVMDDMPTTVRSFLADELGIAAWKETAA